MEMGEDAGSFDVGRLTIVGWLLAIGLVISVIGSLTYFLADSEAANPPGGPAAASAPESGGGGSISHLPRGVKKSIGFLCVAVFAALFFGLKKGLEAVGITVIRPPKPAKG
ncbi:MAG: hypothetical protein U0894_16765 [Pirellulales bacterium]